MKKQGYLGIILMILSGIAIIWSTLFQKKRPWSLVMNDYSVIGFRTFFYHPCDPGSVCWFGIVSGIFIIIYVVYVVYVIIQISLITSESQNQQLKQLLDTSIIINSIIFLLMFNMNSAYAHYKQNRGLVRGLFENSMPFFICQFIGIGLLYTI